MQSAMTLQGGGLLLLLLACLSSITVYDVTALSPLQEGPRHRRIPILHPQKVRGRSDSDGQRRRRKLKGSSKMEKSMMKDSGEDDYGPAFSDDGHHKVTITKSSTTKSTKASKTKGSGKSHTKATGKSDSTKSMMKSHTTKSSSTKHSENIFDHDQTPTEGQEEKQVTEVQCGSEEHPFLSTFVTSIRLRQPPSQEQHQYRPKKKQKKSSKDTSKSKNMEEEDDEDDELELPMDALSPGEQQILQSTFRNVYNNWTFDNCDGFFRTVYSVSMTLVLRDEEDDEYAVTLENTYRMSGNGDGGESDNVEVVVTNGTMIQDSDTPRWLQTLQRRSFNVSSTGPGRHANASATPPKDNQDYDLVQDAKNTMATYIQTVSGGDDLPIYYVSLAATCRNCDVTDEVNFPLLMVEDDDGDEGVHPDRIISSRQGGDIIHTSARVEDKDAEDEEEDVCKCLLPVENNEEETSRRYHRRQRRRLDGHDLYVPPPNGPTAQEYIDAMNKAIRRIQNRDGKLLRVAGIMDLIEPDYFQGEDPELVPMPTITPTSSPMPTVSAVPTQPPTFSAEPTATRAPTGTPTRAPVFASTAEGGAMAPLPPSTAGSSNNSSGPATSTGVSLTRPPTDAPASDRDIVTPPTIMPTTSSAGPSSRWTTVVFWAAALLVPAAAWPF